MIITGRTAALFGITCLLCVQAPIAIAQPSPGFSLAVTPTRLVVPAGASEAVQRFVVSNGGRKPFTVTVDKADFTASENGALAFRPDAPYAAAEWVRVTPRRFTMQPGTTRNVTFQITLPDKAEPGDHQLALIFKVPARGNAANIRINRGIATPVFIAVPGGIDDETKVDGVEAPGFALHGPIAITTRVSDRGTVHRDFRGKGRLRVEAGGGGVAFPDFTVLRGATRQVTTRWNPPLMCVCHATVAVRGAHGTRSAATVRIIVLPVHLLAAGLAAGLVLLLGAKFTRRRYRARILAAATALNAKDDDV